MKKNHLRLLPSFGLYFLALISFLSLSIGNMQAQVLATYPLKTGGTNPTAGTASPAPATSANVTAGTLVSGTSMLQNSYNGTGYRVKTNSLPWATSLTNGFGFDIPLKPKTGWDMNITSIKFDVAYIDFDLGSGKFTIQPFFQVDGAGPWVALSAAQGATAISTITFTANETFYSGHSYVIRFNIFNQDGSSNAKNDEMRIANLIFGGTTYQPISQPVTVTTVSATATGKYTGSATGTYSYNGTQYYLVKQSGVIWSTDPVAINTMDTSATTKTTNGSVGNIASNITGLNAATKYYVKAYIVTQFGLQYGTVLNFTTDPKVIPTVTLTLSNILSNKVTGLGAIPDSGGAFIEDKGFVYIKNGSNPTLTSNTGSLSSGTNATTFTNLIKGLEPNTNYCVRAYAKNSEGVGYSKDSCFVTGAPVPVLTAIPGTIDFGPNFYGASPITVSYILTGKYLSPSSGTITITCPAPFKVSTLAGSGFSNTITVSYFGGKITTPIYVQLPTSTYGSWGYTSNLTITHSGGGTAPADADVVKISGSIEQAPEDVSNRGTDFWLGFGYHNRMKSGTTDATTKSKLTVYVATGSSPAKVTVEIPGMPGGGYPQTAVSIPANTTKAFIDFPDGVIAGIDARLFTTGVFSKGIHVYSVDGTPVSVWAYISTTNDAAAGSMIFPSNTWNSNYTVQAYGDNSNNGLPNSYFFVIANEDNTAVTINPSTPIIAENQAFIDNPTIGYPAGVPFTVTLNKGDVFNAMGVITGSGNSATSSGYDLSGTTVSTTCDKKIAVFGGNGRSYVSTPASCVSPNSGSDNMIQQMVPSVAWDTKYFTVPTKNMERNLFRIYVRDNTQQVWINDETHGAAAKLLNTAGVKVGSSFSGNYTFVSFVNGGGYYSLETSQPIEIESDQPISVTQFISSGSCGGNPAIGNNGEGDPEMIILTGAQQAITNGIVYSPVFQNGNTGAHYINVVIPKEGISSFKIDNSAIADTGRSSYVSGQLYQAGTSASISTLFKPYSNNPNYYWAKFRVTGGTAHTMSASVPFNAIAYGLAKGESYGFNAGTLIKNLQSIKFAANPNGNDTSNTVVRTCINNPVTLKIALPYNPSLVQRIDWVPGGDPRITPNTTQSGAVSGGVATYQGTVIADDGRTFYVYSSPVQYTFKEQAVYNFTAIAYGTFKSDCAGEDRQKIIVVVGRDNAYFETKAACGSPTVTIDNYTTPMANTDIKSWLWEFGDGQTNNTSNPGTHTYTNTSGTVYNMKLTTVNSIGCYSYYETQVDFGGGLQANFSIDPAIKAACQGGTFTFTDNTTASGTSGIPKTWAWDFGDGTTVSRNASSTETHQYNNAGKFYIKLTVTTDQNCTDIYIDSVTIEATPVAKFSATTPCKGDVTTFTDLSTISIGTLGIRTWDFGDGSAPYPDNGTTVTHTYADSGTYTVKLSVLSSGGCPSAVYTGTAKVLALPKDSFDIDVNCTTKEVTFTDKSLTYGQTITEWNWVFDGVGEKHTNGNPFKKTFNDALEHTVSLTVKTTNGCTNSVGFERKFTISVSPVADFDIPAKVCLPNDAAIFTNKTTINDPLNTNAINEIEYKWEFGDNSVQNQLAPAPGTMSHAYAGVGPFTVKLTATSGKGCTNSITKTINTIFAQPKATFTAPAEVCLKESASFASTASAAASSVTKWYWDFGTGSFVGSSTKDTAQSWTVAGTKAIRHYAESAVGCISDTASKSVVVNPLPIASFEQKTVSCAGKEVEFTDKSDPVTTGTTLTQWVWDYGDGTKETKTNNTNLKHTYAVGGAYTVKLVVKNSKGCVSDTFRLAVNVYPNPVANFDLPGNICLPNAVGTFKNTTTITDGTGNQISYVWNFGDGTPDQSVAAPSPTNINHTYTAVGPFTIKLTATSNQGCVGETSKTLSTIFDQPKASFDAPTEVCLNDDASFSSTSTAASSTISRWFWDLGTGSFTEGKKDTTESWSVSGDKTIQLYAISAVGCYSDTALKTVTVNPLPIASLELKSSSCAGKDVEFTDKSDAVTTSATLTQWFLDYGDGSNEILNNNLSIKHTYAIGGSYTVKLVVKNSKGCVSDTFRLPIFVYPNPVPGFKVSDICLPLVNAQFTDTSKITSGSIVKWTWDFGDGSTAGTDQNPLHVYAIGNQYNVTLTVESDHGCSTTGTPVAIYAYNAPTAGDSVVLANNLCSNLPVKLVNTSAVNGYGSVTKLEVYWDYANNPSLKTTDNAPVVGTTYEYKYPEFGTPLTKTYQVVVRAYTNTGCFDDSVQTITLHASPKVVFNAIPGVCQEADTVLLTQAYDQYALAPNIGYYSGTGVLDGTNRFVPALAGPGTHVIRYDDTTAIGCVSSATQSIVVYPTPIIKMAPTKAILEGDSYTLNPTVTGIIQSYLWSPTTYMLSSNTIINPVVKPEKDITYTLTVTTTNGCEADSSIFIKVLKNFEVPNTFTPNNDGINDHWKIKELPDYPIHRVQIFNRYGQIVYETKAYPARGWDGNYNGKSLPIGTYYYIIELNGLVNPKVGYVTILK